MVASHEQHVNLGTPWPRSSCLGEQVQAVNVLLNVRLANNNIDHAVSLSQPHRAVDGSSAVLSRNSQLLISFCSLFA